MTDTPFPKNPYVIGVPLTGEVGFYGRRAIFTFVEDTLDTEQQNVIVLYGQRRVGKTSLLHQLVGQLKDTDVLPIYFDLQGRAQQNLGQVLYQLARTITRPLKMNVAEQAKFDQAGHFFREEFLPALYRSLDQRRLLLLFDEFDVLGDELNNPETASETLFPYLQDLIMHHRQIAFIFVVGRRIEELATHFQAIFKQAVYRRVGLLQPEDAWALIVEPVKEVLVFDEEAIEAIINLTAGHPYFTQLICFELFNAVKAKNQRRVVKVDIFKLVNQAIESGHGALTWFWDGLPRAERFIMSAVAHVTNERGLASKEDIRHILEKHRIVLSGLELTDAPDRLVEWEMLRREEQDNYGFVVELVRRWIIKMHPLESARRDVDYISQRAVRLYENARDAHSADDLEYAHDEYRRALAANPNHSGAQLGLAQVLFELNKIEEAIEEFTKAFALDEMSARDGLVQARLILGKNREEDGQSDQAILQYEQALQIAPTHETIRRRLATIWIGRGHTALANESLANATEIYQKVLEFDNNETFLQEIRLKLEAYIKLAEEDQNYETVSQAIQHLRILLPTDEVIMTLAITFWTRRGDTLAKEGEGAEAIRAYQHALELNPSNVILTEKLEAISVEWKKLLEIDALFTEAMQSHQATDWLRSQENWHKLIKMDVLLYKKNNIAKWLAEAIEFNSAKISNEEDNQIQDRGGEGISEARKQAQTQLNKLQEQVVQLQNQVSTLQKKEKKAIKQAEDSPSLKVSQFTEMAFQSFEPEMILIPAGEFIMGSDPKKDKNSQSNEQPLRTMYLSDYYLAKTPITNGQFAAFVVARYKSAWFSGLLLNTKENYPIVNVSWYDAIAYCIWLTEVTGKPYQLPSEAEWEKGARGNDGRIYPWSNEWKTNRCNSRKENLSPDLIPVGKYSDGASPYGLLDMVGNVWEWTKSLDYKYPYVPTDGRENAKINASRILRGGSFLESEISMRCTARISDGPNNKGRDIGFRVALISS